MSRIIRMEEVPRRPEPPVRRGEPPLIYGSAEDQEFRCPAGSECGRRTDSVDLRNRPGQKT